MVNLIFTLVSAVLGIAMFGAVLLAPASQASGLRPPFDAGTSDGVHPASDVPGFPSTNPTQ